MKKVLIAALLLIGTQGVFAQINQGQWMVGGTASFSSQKYKDFDDSKVTNFSLNPNAGYFFIDNLAGGLRVNLSSSKPKDGDASSSFLVAPFVRYYFLPAVQKVNVFADASYGFGSMKDGESDGLNAWAISAGPAVFLTPNTALEFTLNYTSMGGDAIGEDTRLNSFGINVGFQIHLGAGKK